MIIYNRIILSVFKKSGNKLIIFNFSTCHFVLISHLGLTSLLLVELEVPDTPPHSDVRQEGDGHAGSGEPADVLPHQVRVVELAVGPLPTGLAPDITGLV